MMAHMIGEFDGYASLYGWPDLGRDVVAAGAFDASLKERGGASGIKLLWQHDPTQPIGIWTEMRSDQRGLYVKGALNLSVQRGQELFALLQQGAVRGLSIGFRTQKAHQDGPKRLRILTRIDLWEVSLVTFPLLPAARVMRVADSPSNRRHT
jgi:HK97 family phage prohead protease